MSSLAKAPSGGVPQLLTGSPVAWGRDLALIGAVTGFAAPASVLGLAYLPFHLTSAGVGLVCGMFLGLEMPRFLETARRRLPLLAIGGRCVAVGAAVGAFIGLVSAQAAGQLFLGPFAIAGIAGALQFGWLWLPYTVLTVLQRPTWPIVVVACALAPILGPLSMLCARLLLAMIL